MALDKAIAQLDALISKLSAQDIGASDPANGCAPSSKTSDQSTTTDPAQPSAPSTPPVPPPAAPPAVPAGNGTEQMPLPAAQPKAKKAKPVKQAAPEPAADSGEGLFARAQLRVGDLLLHASI